MVSCEDGYEWTGGNTVIVCEAGTWNISSKCQSKSYHTEWLKIKLTLLKVIFLTIMMNYLNIVSRCDILTKCGEGGIKLDVQILK